MSVPNPKKILFATDLTAIETVDIEGAGAVREAIDGQMYKWVKNGEASSVTASVNGAACYDGSNRASVKIPTTAEFRNLAGFWQAAVPGQSYGWIKTKGTGPILCSRVATASHAAYLYAMMPLNASYLLGESAASLAANAGGYAVLPASVSANSDSATYTANGIFSCRL